MNSIIWKEKSSRDFNSLVIQELPPISRPPIRTMISEIEGVDGDKVEQLGYMAYDKEMSVGIKNMSEIDDIIEYFSGSGEVIFSNEPDKYYKASIVSGIDFERLVRFRTATVVFHVQPFKYAVEEVTQVIDTSSLHQIEIVNSGNTQSKPIIQLEGSGTITISYNNKTIIFTFDSQGHAKFDSEAQDVSWNGVLLNRKMIGDFFLLEKGTNVISWTGTINSFTIDRKSRWL